MEETGRDEDIDLLSAVNAVCCLLRTSFALASSISAPWTQNHGPVSPIPTAVGMGRILK